MVYEIMIPLSSKYFPLMTTKTLIANLIDLHTCSIYLAEMTVKDGKIHSLVRKGEESSEHPYLLPGFVDAHVHIESSMLVPSKFGEQALRHGTVATISDPHEIANVMGNEGISFMVENAKNTALKIYFGVPSCVPATKFETSGATLTAEDIGELFDRYDLLYLSEMMNYPGVISRDPDVMAKIAEAKKRGKKIDGHAPGLRGQEMVEYFSHGISTDHECYTLDEAIGKANVGVNILIREGSAAKNYEALKTLLLSHPSQVMFCSDDKHPDDLYIGHINLLVKRAIQDGFDLFHVLRAASLNPVRHYGLDVGLLSMGDPTDFIVIDNLSDFTVLQTWIEGEQVWPNPMANLNSFQIPLVNKFDAVHVEPTQLQLRLRSDAAVKVIHAIDGELITERVSLASPASENGINVEEDILKLVVVNRYHFAKPAIALIKGFGLKRGALASTVAHDCHNIIAVGTEDELIAQAINTVVDCKGGIAAVDYDKQLVLPLSIAGLMSDKSCAEVAHAYQSLDRMAKDMGSTLQAPYMTLSFMALLVIPKIKLSDLGLFDGLNFQFLTLQDAV